MAMILPSNKYGSEVTRRSPASRRHENAPARRTRRATGALLLACGLSTVPLSTAVAAPSDTVSFADPTFRACVAGNLGMPASSPVTRAQAGPLTIIDYGDSAPASLAGAEALTNLSELSLFGGSKVSDLVPLAKLTALQELNLPGSKVTDLTPLSGLTGMTELNVADNPVKSLAPLSRLTRLTSLDVTGATWTSLEPLRGLTALRRLNADQEGQVDISAVAVLTSLDRLTLTVPDVRSLAPLQSLTLLTRLNVQAAATDISALAPMSRLQVLSLNVKGGDGAALAGKPYLTDLSVYGLRLRSLDAIASSTNLSSLIVASDGLGDVSALKNMDQLGELILSGVDQADFRPLSQLPDLGYVSVASSRLGPPSQFNDFMTLNTLELTEDQIDSLAGFRVPANLTYLNLSSNHLRDISMLPCSLLVNARDQTVVERQTQARQRYQLSLSSIPQQTVELDASPLWTTSGTAITYAKAGSYQVPFFVAGPPECGGVEFEGVVSQNAVTRSGSYKKPPHDR